MTEVTVSRTCVKVIRCERFTSGRVGARIKFSFSSEWAGLRKTAVFTNGDTTIDVLNVADEITIPHEVLAISGKTLKVGVYGYTIGDNGNIEIAIPTVYGRLGSVLEGVDPSGDVSADPSLPVWAQVQEAIGNLNDLTTEAKNNLVAAINEAAQSGGGGGSTVELDTTLTQSGKAADAKAVGDRFSSLSAEIANGVSWNELKDKPFYLEKTLFIELTKNDFTVNNQGGRFKYMYRSMPKLDWFTSAESIAFEIELVDINGRRYTATQDSIDIFFENDTTDEGYEYWTCYSDLFDIVSGVDLDFYDDRYYYKDEWGVLVHYYGIEFSEINIKIYRVDVKKIPKICLDAAIGKTAITVGSIVYGGEGEIPTNVVVPDLLIPISPTSFGEEIYYDRRVGRLRTSGSLFKYGGIVKYTFPYKMPTTAGSSISFDISSEGDTLWDKICYNSPWCFGGYLTFELRSSDDEVIEFLSRGISTGRNITTVATDTSGNLYTVLFKYTNSDKTLNVTIKYVA